MAGIHEHNNNEEQVSPTETKNSKKKTKTKKHNFKKASARLFYGVGKEFNRITWTSKDKIIWNFLVIVVIAIFLTLIFLGIDYIFLTLI